MGQNVVVLSPSAQKASQKMRLVCISDTHSRHDKMPPLPDGDVLVHAGDCTGSGTLAQLENFADWYGRQPHKKKVLIAGNHDYCFERDPEQSLQICENRSITYLIAETAIINGIHFYGFPWQPVFRNMAFNADESKRRDLLAAIPDDTEVLVTHSPAFLIFDWVPWTREHVGCNALAQRINQLTKLKAHICGHIHEGHGFAIRESDSVKFANASICTERYEPSNKPIIIDLD